MRDLVGSIADAMMNQNAEGALKVAADLERYKRVIADTKPGLIVESGTCAGHSARWFADTAACPVITIDVKPVVAYDTWKQWAGRVTPVIGSSTSEEVLGEVYALMAHNPVPTMVVLDSDHSAEHVKAEMAVYAPMVTPGCYLVVEDTLVRWMPWFGIEGSPLDAVEEFMETHTGGWEVDTDIEDFSSRTQHPSGFLRRVS